jgi:Rieske Fe-S protein
MTFGDEVMVIERLVRCGSGVNYNSRTMYPALIGKTGVVKFYDDEAYNTDYPTGYERVTVTVEIDGKEHDVDGAHVVKVCQVCKHMGCRGGEHTYNQTCLCTRK